MINIKINNINYNAAEGLTILDVARGAGLNIPTLCFKDGLPHYSSCMVCMVKDKRTNIFIPSCTALIQDGMDIDISGEDVLALRKKAIELLLSEHRAECEAPCKVVCPAGYNIPLMNRLIANNDIDGAIRLSLSALNTEEIQCLICPGYCENACRRKKVDLPVSIRNLQLLIYQAMKKAEVEVEVEVEVKVKTEIKVLKTAKRFKSLIGKLEPFEIQEWTKECSGNLSRSRDIPDFNTACSEAESCMHCDCRAADNCRLRDLSEELLAKDPRGKLVNSPIVKKINHDTGLIFENAKCIKCGLCVRLCENEKIEPGLCFIHRGFVSIISEPLTKEFNDILKTKSKEVIDICPTGALSQMK